MKHRCQSIAVFSHLNTYMILFDCKLCLALILAAILGEVLRFAMGVHICVHNRHFIHVSCINQSYMSRLSNTVCA